MAKEQPETVKEGEVERNWQCPKCQKWWPSECVVCSCGASKFPLGDEVVPLATGWIF